MDPSVSLDNGSSPFLDSNDQVTDTIFRRLSECDKEKMRMALVCKKFRSRIQMRSSWDGENVLKLGQDGRFIVINGFKFSFGKAPTALAELLDRITVENLAMDEMSNVPEKLLLDLCRIIAKRKHFINLKFIQFTKFSDDSDTAVVMSTIIGCGLEQLREIECGGDFSKDHHHLDTVSFHFYPILLCCHNLKVFTLYINDLSSVWEYLLPALTNCSNITTLNILGGPEQGYSITHQKAVEFAKNISSTFPKLTALDFWFPIEPFEFLNALDENGQIMSNMTSFGIALDAEILSHNECLKGIFDYFPNLKMLDVRGSGYFSTDTVMDSIENIFETYGGEASAIYEFELTVNVKSRAEVIFHLAEGDDFVEVLGKNGVWRCFKNNVQISLDLAE